MSEAGRSTATMAASTMPNTSQCAISSRRSRKAYVKTRRRRAACCRGEASAPPRGRWTSGPSSAPGAASAAGGPPASAAAPCGTPHRLVAMPATTAVSEAAGEDESQQEVGRGLLEDRPDLEGDLQEERDHAVILRGGRGSGPGRLTTGPRPTNDGAIRLTLFGQILLVEGAGHRVLRVDHVGHLDHGLLAEELVGLRLVVAVVGREPVDQVRAGQPERVHERASAADRHDVPVILEPGPVDLLALDDLHRELDVERGLDGGAHDLAVALGGVAVAEHEEGPALEDREPHGDALHYLVEVHVGAVGARHERADALLAVRRRADRAEEGPERNLDLADLALGHGERADHAPRVELPHEERVLHGWRDHHRLVLGRERAEVRDGPAPAPFAVEADAVDLHLERVAGLRALDVERPRLRIHTR